MFTAGEHFENGIQMPAPILPWMGSKRRLVPQLLLKTPEKFEVYHEPFVGSGSLLYALCPTKAFVADKLPNLIALHKAVADDFEGLARSYREVSSRGDRRQTFLDIRARHPNTLPAEFLFMMKNCHGTRYRVNSNGGFNCPYKISNAPTISKRSVDADVARMAAVSSYLQANDVRFVVKDYAESLKVVKPGDFVFVDPPYQWQDGKESDYGDKFGQEGWQQLMVNLAKLPSGVFIMVTLHGDMPETEVLRLAEGVPGLTRLQTLTFNGSHLARGGLSQRSEWLLMNY